MTKVTPPLKNKRFSLFFDFTVLRPPGIALPFYALGTEDLVPGNLLQGVDTTHLHGVLQLALELVRIDPHALCAAAVNHGDEGTADKHAIGTQGQGLENIQARADAAVYEDL